MSWTLAVAAMIAAAPVAAPSTVQVMVVGAYHFDNPGRDLNNLKVDDVLAPRRQAELERLADVLAEFRPTKVMVETEAEDLVDPGYRGFAPARLATDRNEIAQIGYRIAHRLDHAVVYAIDEQPKAGEPDYFPFGPVMAFAEANGQADGLKASMARAAAETKANEARQASASIPALLIDYNDEAKFLAGIEGYYGMLAIGDGREQPGAVLNAMWYLRNAKIFAKLMRVAVPGDRVLVVYGAGHGYWLRHFARETPGYRSIDVLPYLRRAALP